MQCESYGYEHRLANIIVDVDDKPMTEQDWEIFLSSIDCYPGDWVEDDEERPLVVPIQNAGRYTNQPKGNTMSLHTIKVIRTLTEHQIYEVMGDTADAALAAFKSLPKHQRDSYLVHCGEEEDEKIYVRPWMFMSDEYLSGQSNYGEKK